VTWGTDFTTTARTDLVGLAADVTEKIVDALVEWGEAGPPRSRRRAIGGVEFYESEIAQNYLIAYIIDASRQRFVILWLREKPGLASP
jgi:hypothetical protein